MENSHEKFMRAAIRLSMENIDNQGGPFGSVVVKDGVIIAEGTNRVTSSNDPTAHAEIDAIRKAAKKLKSFDLSGCDIYASCEPCPMCLAAIYWARINRIFYGNTKDDAKAIGFDDSFIYDEIALPHQKRKVEFRQLLRTEAMEGFKKWEDFEERIDY